MKNEPKPGEVYQHFKGADKTYQIIAIARNCENPGEQDVVYSQLYKTSEFPRGTIWRRSLDDFCGEKEITSGKKVKRFTRL